MKPSILVIGGGIIGLSCAWEAVKRGFKVTVLDKGAIGGQASGAAAGMLAPFAENGEGPDAFFRLCLNSFERYSGWVREIEEYASLTAGWSGQGSLQVALHEADMLPLQSRLQWQSAFGSRGEWVEGKALRELEPALSRDARGALFTPVERHVQAPKLVDALAEACRRAGVRLVAEVGQMLDLQASESGDRSVSVTTVAAGLFQADAAVCCTGAWTGELEGLTGLRLPVHPIRGQICAFNAAAMDLGHMVFGAQAYWVRKPDGSLVCGASEDVAGFDRTVTDRGIGRLVRAGERMLPSLADLQPDLRWAGLRPATLDGWPLIGPVPGLANVYLAAGHHRNGILLSPATAAAFGAWLDGNKEVSASSAACAFLPERFTSKLEEGGERDGGSGQKQEPRHAGQIRFRTM